MTNSNDSYWLSNPAQPLEGFSPIIGAERTARSLRTRAGLVHGQRSAAGEGSTTSSTRERLQNLLFNHRNYGAELALDDVLSICTRESKQVAVQGRASVDVAACVQNAHRLGSPSGRRQPRRADLDGILAAGGKDAEPVAHAV